MPSPTARTLEWLRDNGYLAGVVERRNWFAGPPQFKCPKCNKNRVGKTLDLFGWADIVAVPVGNGGGWNEFDQLGDQWLSRYSTVYIQTTTAANHASRRKKILASPEARTVLQANNGIWVVTWRQAKGKGSRWAARAEPITLSMFPEVA